MFGNNGSNQTMYNNFMNFMNQNNGMNNMNQNNGMNNMNYMNQNNCNMNNNMNAFQMMIAFNNFVNYMLMNNQNTHMMNDMYQFMQNYMNFMNYMNNNKKNNITNNPDYNNNPQNDNSNEINLFFYTKVNSRINIPAKYDEYLGSIITRYINKTHDNNINIYIVNGQKLHEGKTVAENGLINNSHILVEPIQNILGA